MIFKNLFIFFSDSSTKISFNLSGNWYDTDCCTNFAYFNMRFN